MTEKWPKIIDRNKAAYTDLTKHKGMQAREDMKEGSNRCVIVNALCTGWYPLLGGDGVARGLVVTPCRRVCRHFTEY